MPSLTIATDFRGPPTSGHGGYSAGLFAETAGLDNAEVTLRLPPPLDTEMEVRHRDGRAELVAGDQVVATARTLDEPLPGLEAVESDRVVDWTAAEAAEANFLWRDNHPFAGCYGCGPERDDGWRTFGGQVDDRSLTASRARVPTLAAGGGDTLPIREVWAALDCITATALSICGAPLDTPWVLGRYAVRQFRPIGTSEQLVVTAWPRDLTDRKMLSSGLLCAGDEVVATAQATWVKLKG